MTEQRIIHGLIDILRYKESYQQETAGLLPQDMYVLERIFFAGSIYPKELSEEYKLPPSTLTGIIDRLEKKSLIERLRVENNRRAILLQVTKAGRGLVEGHIKEDKIFVENLLSNLSEERRRLFIELLGELVSSVDTQELFKEVCNASS